jgi:hypothetical protein
VTSALFYEYQNAEKWFQGRVERINGDALDFDELCFSLKTKWVGTSMKDTVEVVHFRVPKH